MTREEFLALPEVPVWLVEEYTMDDGREAKRLVSGPGARAVSEDDIIERVVFDCFRWTIYREPDGQVVRRRDGVEW